MNSRNAWVTLATNDTYSLGALVLAHSLKKVKTAFNLVILITPNVTHAMRGTLQSIFDEIKEVDVMDSGDVENLRLLARPELGITFTKLHCWKLTQYEKCVFLDADTLVLQNCDELFEREEFSAAPDVGWPDCFNSGVFVFKPSEETYKNLIDFAITHGSFDGGDQGLLNMFFADWATGNPNKRLPFLYNLSSAAIYSYLPAFKKFGKGVKIVHFISNSKPWLQPFNSVTKTVQTTVDSTHLTDFLQYWWNLFCSAVHPKLSPEMTRQLLCNWFAPQNSPNNNLLWNASTRINPVYIYDDINTPDTPVAPEIEEHFVFNDPWEEFEKIMSSESEKHNPVNCKVRDDFSITGEEILNINNDVSRISHENINFNKISMNDFNDYSGNNFNVSYNSSKHYETKIRELREIIQNNFDNYMTNEEIHDTVSTVEQNPNYISNKNNSLYNSTVNINLSPIHSLIEVLPVESNILNCNHDSNDNSELASSFSQMKLEEPSPEEFAKEDLERFQNWEQGNIDYLGRDSFDNILNKISSTIEQNELKFIESSSSNTSTEQNAENELSKFITSSNESGKKSTAILTVEEKPPISFESCFKEQKDEISIEIKEKDIRPLTRIDMAHQFVKKDSDNADTIKEIAVSPISTKDITEEPQVPSASTEKSTIPSHQNINQELSVSLSSLSTTSDIITKTTDCAVSLTKSEASTDITKETTALDIKSSGTASEVSKYKKQEIGESSSTSNDEESLPKQSLNPTEKKKE